MTTFTNNASTSRNRTAVRDGATDAFARLMSTENITVVRDPSSPTATFNTATRILTLPVFKDGMSKSVTDGLVGHEVGHALYTPSEKSVIVGALDSIDPNNHAVVHDYLNVVEDARIERMMKSKYPGLRRTFVEMYGEFVDTNFFGVQGKQIDELPLIDRINLHFKAGIIGSLSIPFSTEEEIFVKMIEQTKTFDDVVDVSRELYDYVTQPKQDQGNQGTPNNPNGQSGQQKGNGTPSGANADGKSDDQDGGNQGSGDSQSDQNGSGQSQDDADGMKTPTMESENGNNTMNKSGEGEESDSKKDGDTSSGQSSRGDLGKGNQQKQDAPASQTASAMNKALDAQRNTNAVSDSYYRLPTINLDKVVVDFVRVHEDISNVRKTLASQGYTGPRYDCAKMMKKFTESSRDYVQTLVREFERKMAADEQRRTFVSRTGSLDMSRVHTYRFNDDLFLKTSFVADGKNHGMVMFIDWSGSMSPILENTMYQMFNLILFCNALRIPFEVFAFSSCNPNIDTNSHYSTHGDVLKHHYDVCASVCKEYTVDSVTQTDANGRSSTSYNLNYNGCAALSPFGLINLCSSRMNKKQMRDGLENLMFLARNNGLGTVPSYLNLGGTPLDEAVIAAIPVVNKFRKDNKTQIVNTIFLTDGATGSYPFPNHDYNGKVVVRAASGHSYTSQKDQDSTSFLRSILRAETSASVTGFYLVDPRYFGGTVYNFFSDRKARGEAEKQFTDNKFCAVNDKRFGYDNYFLLDASVKSASNKDAGIVGLNAAEAFSATARIKKSTRAILSQFTDTIAKDFVL